MSEYFGRVKGIWHDTYRYLDGRVEYVGDKFEWFPNQIQDSFAIMLAAFCREEAGFNRINFIDYGTGLATWDTTPPLQAPSDTTLENATLRKDVGSASIIFIDPITDLPAGSPTSKLEISTGLSTAEGNGSSFREFGLFGGTATSSVDTGEIINWVVHPRIDKDSSFSIDRIIRLNFAI